MVLISFQNLYAAVFVGDLSTCKPMKYSASFMVYVRKRSIKMLLVISECDKKS
jgi:hypothetical protein